MTLLPPTSTPLTSDPESALPEVSHPTSRHPKPRGTFAQRAVDRAASLLAGRSLTRRRFLTRAAVVGSAMTVSPVGYVLRPTPAYGLVTDCGPANRCGDGWTAFCATITRGANTCPPGSYVAGWWKVDGSSFCPDADGDPSTRYYIDCNRLPGASCSARCSSDPCDGRAICRNNFRYGQCNQQIRGVTEVVCRVVTCIAPWEYDASCTTTVRTDSRTAAHTSPYLAPRNASPIRIRWQDMGQTDSRLGPQTVAERDGAGGGRVAGYRRGWLLWTASTGVHEVLSAIATRYEALGLESSVLGYPVTGDRRVGDGRGTYTRFQHGRIFWSPTTSGQEVTRAIDERYSREGGPTGWLGYPVTGERSAPAGRLRSSFEAGWSIVWDPDTDETRLVPADVEMPADGSWPPTADVLRWGGEDRTATAAVVSAETFPDGAATAYVARSDVFPDALTGGVAAALDGAPLLLTAPDELPGATADELRRLGPERVVVLGSSAAVSGAVERRIRDLLGVDVDRLAGADRFSTAVEVSRAAFPDGASTAYVTTGWNFADAVAGGPAAARADGPLLLVGPDAVPDAVTAELTRLGVSDVVVLGGPLAISQSVVERLDDLPGVTARRRAGADRYATAALIAAQVEEADTVVVVTGQAFPDGLAAAPLAVQLAAPTLLVRSGNAPLPEEVAAQVERLAPSRIVVVGGTAAVSEATTARLSYLAPPS